MANDNGWYIIAPFGESTGSGLSGIIPKGSMAYHATGKTADLLFGDMASNNATPVTINGKKWEVVFGPFPTKEIAQSKSPATPLQVLTGIAVAGTVKATGQSNADAANAGQSAMNSNPLAGLAAIGQFFDDLTDTTFWIRVGKILFGGTLLIVGLIKLTGADQKIGGIADKAVKLTPFL